MDELYSIMRDLLEVNYHQEALLYALEALEAADNDKPEVAKLIAGGTKYYLKNLQEELKETIGSLDAYIVENRGTDRVKH